MTCGSRTAGADEPPHRLRGIQAYRVGESVTDTRVAAPPADAAGEVPQAVAAVAEEALGKFGLPGLVLAGVDDHGKPWALARGWARLDPQEPLSTTRRFPVYAVSTLITATAVLRLAADGRLDLDGPANDHLRTVRLADDDITVRDLLTHSRRPGPPARGLRRDGSRPGRADRAGTGLRRDTRHRRGGPERVRRARGTDR